ncbi:uncharacterized protein [Glycine max]|uniref:uncharacterized protein n=1 Tax=Glycine max TaxID=3847 RepID=UPI0002339DC5|nr:uncharacterized protein LOC100818405 [Glycine max]|eukprot:XP_003523742.1 uncharacterized protein LOC100818405 [Glycine max]
MKRKYEDSVRVKRAQLQALRRDFETLAMKDGESVTNYFARTMEISNKMRFHGEKMTDATIVEKILRSLTTNFNYVVCSIEESKDIDVLSIDELQSSLLVHEQKMNRSSTTEERALKASTTTIFIPPISEEGGEGEVEVGVEEEENVETEKITRIPELILQAKAEDNTLTDPS